MIIKTPQFYAGNLLGFYEAGDEILLWLNGLDTEHMTLKELRSAIVHKIHIMRPQSIGRTATT